MTDIHSCGPTCIDRACVLALRARVAELEKDAARYQWLTDDHVARETRAAVSHIAQGIWLRGKGYTDAAIDDAMR